MIPVGKKVICFGGLDDKGDRSDDLRILSAQNINKMDWVHVPKHVPEPEEVNADGAPEAAEGAPAPEGEAAPAAEAAPAPAAEVEAAPAAEGEAEGAEEGGAEAPKAAAAEEEEDESEKPPPPLVPPGDRLGCGTAFVDGHVYVFGGNATHEDGQRIFTNVMTVGTFEGNAKTFEKGSVEVGWKNVTVTGEIPPPRADFCMTILDGKIVVYGGYDMEGKPIDDMYTYDAENHEWSALYISDGSTIPPSPISAFVQKRLFSISATRSTYDDVRVLDFGKIMEQSTFAPRMAQRVTEELEKVAKWEEAALKDLKIDPNAGADEDKQRDLLLKVNGTIYEYKERSNEFELQVWRSVKLFAQKIQRMVTNFRSTALQMDVLKDAIALLGKHGVNMDKALTQMGEVDDNWAAVKKQAPIAKELGRNVQEREAAKIKSSIETFENGIKSYEFEFRQKALFKYETGVEAAYTDCVKAHKELLDNDKRWAELADFSKIFEFPELMEPSKLIQDRLHVETGQMLQMWHFVDMIDGSINDWNKTLWNDINCEEIEDGAKAIYKQLRGLDKFIKQSDCYTVAEKNVKNFMSTIPLVSDLRHPSMRDRHWAMLMDLTGVKFVIDEHFKLANLLALGLHNFEDDVGEIVNRAQKEEKMEQALTKISGTWVNLEFVFSQHKDTDVQLIKLSEEDFECLEDHQLQVTK